MALAIAPSMAMRSRIEAASGADISPCWTCSTCDQECPVNRATGRLRPQKIVRLATLGLLDETLSKPEIWYCLSCRRCTNVCPNQVKPESLIGHLRTEAVRSSRVSFETFHRYQTFFVRFQRIRRRLASDLLQDKSAALESEDWLRWLNRPMPRNGDGSVVRIDRSAASRSWRSETKPFQVSACFTCSECSNACPIAGDRRVFDPQWIFRMVNLGQVEALLTSPAIWLCIECGRCSDACGQLVQGHRVIAFLREKAVAEGFVPADFPFRWSQAQNWIYPDFVGAIDALLSHCR
jgi:heterodisulfide reductase subunit C